MNSRQAGWMITVILGYIFPKELCTCIKIKKKCTNFKAEIFDFFFTQLLLMGKNILFN